jgi:hypothetical protein
VNDRLAWSIGEVIVGGHVPEGCAPVRCAKCGKTGSIPIETLPLVEGISPVRDDDGTRLGVCPRCIPNRAERRKRRER